MGTRTSLGVLALAALVAAGGCGAKEEAPDAFSSGPAVKADNPNGITISEDKGTPMGGGPAGTAAATRGGAGATKEGR